jgi:hypothetical protein
MSALRPRRIALLAAALALCAAGVAGWWHWGTAAFVAGLDAWMC